ncbi:unnamed protein product [Heligmosomoides polygyrus]|uniref:CWH43-like N-terminal domain-containing protein n=1 Tax=Heligmosomoides polygyrus TaxID=6339 RepID=A0A183GUH7_HELPZ|nr:unnamed protein product [Heligmosomoides polygyrus]
MLFNTLLHHYGGIRETSRKSANIFPAKVCCIERSTAYVLTVLLLLLYYFGDASPTLRHVTDVGDANVAGGVYEVIWRIKVFMFVTGITLSISTAISYPLFLAFCIKEAYVAFSIAEYILVGYNSIFYCLSYWEFPRCRLTLGVFEAPKKVRCSTVPNISNMTKLPL